MRIKNFHTIKMQDDKDSTQYLLTYTANTAAKGLQIAIQVDRAKNENGSNAVHSYYVELQSEAYNPWKQTFEIDGKYYAGCDKFRNIDGYATSAQARKELRVFIADIIAHCEKEEQITSGMAWHLEKHFHTRKLNNAQLSVFIDDYKNTLKTIDIKHDVTASNIAKIERLIREIQEDLDDTTEQATDTTDTTEQATEQATEIAEFQAYEKSLDIYEQLCLLAHEFWKLHDADPIANKEQLCRHVHEFGQLQQTWTNTTELVPVDTYDDLPMYADDIENMHLNMSRIITEAAEQATDTTESVTPTYWQMWATECEQDTAPRFTPKRGAVTTPGGYVPPKVWNHDVVWTVDGIRFDIIVSHDHVAGCDWALPCAYTIKCGAFSAKFDVQGSWLCGCGCDASVWRHGHTNAKQALFALEQWAYEHLKSCLTTIVFGRLGCYTANVPRPVDCYGTQAKGLSVSPYVLKWKHKRIFTPAFIKNALGWQFKNDLLSVFGKPNRSKSYAQKAKNALENTQVYWDTSEGKFHIKLHEFFNHYFECANARIIRALIQFPYKLC